MSTQEPTTSRGIRHAHRGRYRVHLLDGVVDSPRGEEGYKHTGWTFNTVEQDPTMYDFKLEEAREVEALLLGRRTYEGFAGAWPEREGEFADTFNSMPKYVVSSTLKDPAWNNTTVDSVRSGVCTDAAVPALKIRRI